MASRECIDLYQKNGNILYLKLYKVSLQDTSNQRSGFNCKLVTQKWNASLSFSISPPNSLFRSPPSRLRLASNSALTASEEGKPGRQTRALWLPRRGTLEYLCAQVLFSRTVSRSSGSNRQPSSIHYSLKSTVPLGLLQRGLKPNSKPVHPRNTDGRPEAIGPQIPGAAMLIFESSVSISELWVALLELLSTQVSSLHRIILLFHFRALANPSSAFKYCLPGKFYRL